MQIESSDFVLTLCPFLHLAVCVYFKGGHLYVRLFLKKDCMVVTNIYPQIPKSFSRAFQTLTFFFYLAPVAFITGCDFISTLV